MAQHTQYLTQQLYLNELSDGDDISTFFYTLPSTFPNRNPYNFPDDEKNPLRFVDVADLEHKSGVYCRSDASEGELTQPESVHCPKEPAHCAFAVAEADISISIWVIVNDASERGLALINAVKQLVVSFAIGLGSRT